MRHLRLVTKDEGELRFAFASSNRRTVDQHFGAAGAFAIYALRDGVPSLVEVAEFHDTAPVGGGSHEGRLAGKIALLTGCAAVYCNAVGASAISQLLAAGIQPVKVTEGSSIEAIMQQIFDPDSDPPVWLERYQLQQRRSSDRFQAMAAEGWQE
jgi:nitrogen fixation protein NifX